MRTVSLGSSGLTVSAVGLGCMGMSEFYGPADHDTSLEVLERAVDVGVTFLDTSDAYGVGANERLLDEFLARGRRDRVVLATKFGVLRDPETGLPRGMRGDPEYVAQACDASLRRLGVEYIDLYYLHLPDPRTPITETVAAMAGLIAAGKVRHIGLSNVTAEQLRAAHQVHPIAAVQNEWSLFTRDVEESMVPACAELGVGLVPYSPLGRGFLTGVYTSTEGLTPNDYRQAVPRFAEENARQNEALLKVVEDVAKTHGATLGQVALAWLHARGEADGVAVAPIPGTKQAARLAENAGAAAVRLTAEDLAALDPIADAVLGEGRPPLPPAVASAR